MATLTALLNLSKNALLANQTALNVTANNVANQNTPGYTREIVNFQTADTVTIGGIHYGEGVTTGIGATSVRDRVLEQRVQQQTQTAAQTSNLTATLNQVQNIFGLTSSTTAASSTTLGSAIDSFFNSFSTLNQNPSDTSTRTTVLSAAASLAQTFNAASSQLQSTSTALDAQAVSLTKQVNNLVSQIASLNKQITSQYSNVDAGPIEDQRQTAVTNLSKLIGLDQIQTENNGITLTTTGGALLVSAGQAYPIGTSQLSGITHLIAGFGNVDITAGITGGSLGGVLQARDHQVPAFRSTLDQLAYGLATSVNTQNAAGLDAAGNPGAAIFTLPATSATAAAVITVAPGVTPASIAAAAVGEGATGGTNAAALAQLANTANTTNLNSLTPSGFFASFLSQIGSAAAAATSDDTVQQTALTQLTSQRDTVSAVSLDEEAANLSQYQRSYEAASKIFSIVNQLLADALNIGVETAVN